MNPRTLPTPSSRPSRGWLEKVEARRGEGKSVSPRARGRRLGSGAPQGAARRLTTKTSLQAPPFMNLQNPQVSSSSSLAGTRTQELDRAKERDRVLDWSQFGVGQCNRGRVPEHLPPPQSPCCSRSPPQVSRRTWVRHDFPLARSPPEPQRPPPPARPGPPRLPLWPSSRAPPGRSRSISEKPAAKLSGI